MAFVPSACAKSATTSAQPSNALVCVHKEKFGSAAVPAADQAGPNPLRKRRRPHHLPHRLQSSFCSASSKGFSSASRPLAEDDVVPLQAGHLARRSGQGRDKFSGCTALARANEELREITAWFAAPPLLLTLPPAAAAVLPGAAAVGGA